MRRLKRIPKSRDEIRKLAGYKHKKRLSEEQNDLCTQGACAPQPNVMPIPMGVYTASIPTNIPANIPTNIPANVQYLPQKSALIQCAIFLIIV